MSAVFVCCQQETETKIMSFSSHNNRMDFTHKKLRLCLNLGLVNGKVKKDRGNENKQSAKTNFHFIFSFPRKSLHKFTTPTQKDKSLKCKKFTLSMFGTRSCSFLILSLILVLLTCKMRIHTVIRSIHSCFTFQSILRTNVSFSIKMVRFYQAITVSEQRKTYPLCDTSWMSGTTPLGSNFTWNGILELQ